MRMRVKSLMILLLTILFVSCDPKEQTPADEGVSGVSVRTEEEMAELIDYAPEFKLESIEGGQVALSDLKGKYVYIDIWATWCGPCLRQIPAMKELEEKYRGKNIEIMSISVDSEKDKDKWRKMIEVREMKGIQLFAGRSSSFHRDYKIKTIPKFVLVGKNGEIIDENPPRPMDHRTGELNQELIDIFDRLLEE